VLEGFYGYAREQVSLALTGIVGATNLSIEVREEVREALNQYNAGADFPDVLIGLVNLRRGCEHTLTFESKSRATSRFSRVVK
jgi:predicted nucleic-acid-binding protein